MKKIIFLIPIIVISYTCQKEPTTWDQLRGLWSMHIFEYQDSTGQWQQYPWNADGTGYLLYDGQGGMAAHFTPKDYKESSLDLSTPLDSLDVIALKDRVELFSSNYVYIGKVRILGDSILEHTRLSHTFPEDWGVVVQRQFRFKGDTLLMYPVEGDVVRRLKWVRKK